MPHTGPVTLVIMAAHTTEREKNYRAYGNAYTRYRHLDVANAADFPGIASARTAAAAVLRSKGASAQDVEAVNALRFGQGLTTCGLHILIRETD